MPFDTIIPILRVHQQSNEVSAKISLPILSNNEFLTACSGLQVMGVMMIRQIGLLPLHTLLLILRECLFCFKHGKHVPAKVLKMGQTLPMLGMLASRAPLPVCFPSYSLPMHQEVIRGLLPAPSENWMEFLVLALTSASPACMGKWGVKQ